MIERTKGPYSLICTICKHKQNGTYATLEDARYTARRKGWELKKDRHGWEYYCPYCKRWYI